MKTLLLLLLLLTGCGSIVAKSTQYCDSNWQGRYESWQACYDRQYQARKDESEPLNHIGDGLQNKHSKTRRCSTNIFNETTCN